MTHSRTFDFTDYGYQNDMTPAELHAFQASFDAEFAQADTPDVKLPTDGAWARWGLPLAILFGVIVWTIAADLVIDWLSAFELTTTR